MFKYSISIRWSEEDEGFIATVPELEGLSAFGETQEEAAHELLEAAEAFIETMKAAGDQLPEPSKVSAHSGQIRLRMPKGLHARLAAEAEKENVSLNTYLVSLLSERQGVREAMNAVRTEVTRTRGQFACPVAKKSSAAFSDFGPDVKGSKVLTLTRSSAPTDFFYRREEN